MEYTGWHQVGLLRARGAVIKWGFPGLVNMAGGGEQRTSLLLPASPRSVEEVVSECVSV
jgi:hypothetical protein